MYRARSDHTFFLFKLVNFFNVTNANCTSTYNHDFYFVKFKDVDSTKIRLSV